jgi:hypothetical protein
MVDRGFLLLRPGSGCGFRPCRAFINPPAKHCDLFCCETWTGWRHHCLGVQTSHIPNQQAIGALTRNNRRHTRPTAAKSLGLTVEAKFTQVQLAPMTTVAAGCKDRLNIAHEVNAFFRFAKRKATEQRRDSE